MVSIPGVTETGPDDTLDNFREEVSGQPPDNCKFDGSQEQPEAGTTDTAHQWQSGDNGRIRLHTSEEMTRQYPCCDEYIRNESGGLGLESEPFANLENMFVPGLTRAHPIESVWSAVNY